MFEYPFAYEKIASTTWAYFSSLLMLAIFFKFNRFWSFRNFDLFLIILLAPGIILVDFGQRLELDGLPETAIQAPPTDQAISESGSTLSQDGPLSGREQTAIEAPVESIQIERGQRYQRIGYYWLLSVCLAFLVRTLIDPLLVRKPHLATNLSVGGLVFLMLSLMTFLFANILTSQLSADDLASVRSTIKMIRREAAQEIETLELRKRGPGLPLFQLFPIVPTFSNGQELLRTDMDENINLARYATGSKTLAIVSQSGIVIGLILLGYLHFSNLRIGFGMATIYLMLPYTAQYMGHVIHVLPGALLVWALVCFRRPWLSGALIGLATGVVYYPLFLLPLWISFYWERGVRPFVVGFLVSIAVCVATLIFTSVNVTHFFQQLQATFGFWTPIMDGLKGIWGLGWDSSFRLPILVAFVALCLSFVFWPTEKNLGTLFAYTCAIMIGVQFWHGFEGGLIMAWFMPTALMTFFRPNLDGRDAKTELKGTAATSAPLI